MTYLAVVLSVVIAFGSWTALDRLNTLGLEALAWKRPPHGWVARGSALGATAAVAAVFIFNRQPPGLFPPWTTVWMNVTVMPLFEEFVFRGYLFQWLQWLFRRSRFADALAVGIVAVAFSAAHADKAGIGIEHLTVILLTGSLFGWLRARSGSTVPGLFAHAAYNAVIYLAAFVRT